jgi:phosphohistidine phosphatase
MKQLLLLRHAKSSWDDAGLADRDRPLSSRGRRDASSMADEIAAYLVDRVLCSPARRTLETLAGVLPSLRGEPQIAITEELYESLTGDYRALIGGEGGSFDCLLVIGHNPAIQATAMALAGGGDETALAKLSGKYPTGALAVIAFDVGDWTKVKPHSGELTAFLRPRDLDKPD